MNAWNNGQTQKALEMYFKISTFTSEAMTEGSALHKLWENEVKKTNCLPKVFGGRKLNNPLSEQKKAITLRKEFDGDLLDDVEFVLSGIVDLIDGDLIIDYKTGNEDRDDPHQLPIYDLLVRSWLKKDVSRLSYLHLESGNWSTQNSTEPGREETKRFVVETTNQIPKEFDRKFFICSLREACNHCDYLREIGFEPILD